MQQSNLTKLGTLFWSFYILIICLYAHHLRNIKGANENTTFVFFTLAAQYLQLNFICIKICHQVDLLVVYSNSTQCFPKELSFASNQEKEGGNV